MRRTGTTRRGALTAAGALAAGTVLAGCSGEEQRAAGHTGTARPARTSPEQRLRTASVRTSAALLARYDEVAAAHPATDAGLAPLRAAVRQHTEALAEGTATPSPSPSAPAPTSPGPVSSASTAPTTEAVVGTATAAGDARTALKELAAEARRAGDAHTASLLEAEPELSRLLASVAAACGVHAYLLTELAKETPAS
ncbi:hypothetical protein [Streptomyces sp. NBC_00102]|uniref:hypothetical protein n=1 Tax=Streptomyces sp. NBC_00102 TaxID=2975652 RepID=UPI002259F2D6|nr:hypothetical protein [Streptomyces sp. NBC_00102]MCX5400117.1 hypothetical protein [Streptomyces sp. NBC_00102]